MSFSVALSTYLLVGAMLFSLGLYGIFAKKNVIAVLMSIELMLNAVNLNFVAFNRFLGNESVLHGFVTAVFIIVLAAAEVAVGLALVISIYRTRKSTNVDEFNWLKW